MSRTALIVSPYFPPSTLAGVHRGRHLAKHLPGAGWTPIIVAVDEAFHEQKLDQGLASLVPETAEVVKVGALPSGISRSLGIGDISLRAWRPLRRAVMDLLEARDVGAVLITGSPYYPMLMAGEIKRRFGVPVILDFQDPWVSAWGASLTRWSKGGLSHRLATALEPRVIQSAAFITSVSETHNGEMAARYPWFAPSNMAAIPIGGDPEDYDALRRKSEHAIPSGESGPKTLAYVGTFMPRTGPVMEQFLRGFALARARRPDVMGQVRLRFVGTSNQPNDTFTYRVRPLAKALGLADVVEEMPQRLPYLKAITVLAQSDGILLIGSDEPHYTASKIYPGLMSGRPYLSIFHERSSSHDILFRAGGGIALGFADATGLNQIAEKVAGAIIRIVATPADLGQADPKAYEPYTARAVSGQFAAIFDALAASGAGSN